jgi:hypothetical protein
MPQASDELWTPAQVAAYYKIPIRTLHQWRWQGVGPRAAKIGRHLRYRKVDLDRYFDQQAKGGDGDGDGPRAA